MRAGTATTSSLPHGSLDNLVGRQTGVDSRGEALQQMQPRLVLVQPLSQCLLFLLFGMWGGSHDLVAVTPFST